MRLFIAASLAPETLDFLQEAQSAIKRHCPTSALVPAENLHLTLRFIGETDAQTAERIRSAMAEMILPSDECALRFTDWGRFRQKNGDLIWAGFAAGAALRKTAENVGRLLSDLGLSGERRDWLPHTTLARHVRFPEKHGNGQALLDDAQLCSSAEKMRTLWRQTPELLLIKSELQPSGARYSACLRRPLARFHGGQASD